MSARPSSRRRPGRPPAINLLAMDLEDDLVVRLREIRAAQRRAA